MVLVSQLPRFERDATYTHILRPLPLHTTTPPRHHQRAPPQSSSTATLLRLLLLLQLMFDVA